MRIDLVVDDELQITIVHSRAVKVGSSIGETAFDGVCRLLLSYIAL